MPPRLSVRCSALAGHRWHTAPAQDTLLLHTSFEKHIDTQILEEEFEEHMDRDVDVDVVDRWACLLEQ
jgi:hypothetical protein